MSKVCGVYKITSPTGKIYIGQSVDIVRRFKRYASLDCAQQIKLYRSFLKHGVDSHVFEIIEECLRESLNEREIHWGILYDSTSDDNLNSILGNTNAVFSESTKKKMSLQRLGVPKSDEHRKSMSDSHKGKIKTPEHCKNISIGKKKKGIKDENNIGIKNRISVLQYTSDMVFVKEWESYTSAAKSVGIHRTTIYNHFRGLNKLAGGYIWKLKQS